jgi:hypothetical protein
VASIVTERAAKRIVIETEEDSSEIVKTSPLKSEQILMPIANVENIEKLLEFSIFIKDKRSTNPVSILSVVSNNSEAEVNILKARNKLEEFVKQASASETKANILTTIDHNIASGIARISRETMTDIIVLGWPRRTGLLDKLIGEKVDSILANTYKTTVICHFERPLALHKRIVVVAPPLAERENGFELWVGKMAKLAQELSIPITLRSNAFTEAAVKRVVEKNKLRVALSGVSFDSWDDFFTISPDIKSDDLLVLVSARQGSASYMNVLENLPSKMERHFQTISRLVIYPQEYDNFNVNKRYEVINTNPLGIGLDKVQKLGKGIGGIFKRDKPK